MRRTVDHRTTGGGDHPATAASGPGRPPSGAPHPGRVLGALSGADRLRVFAAAVLHGPTGADELAAATGLSTRAVARALDPLRAAGLIEVLDGGAVGARGAGIRDAARVASRMRPERSAEDLGATPEQAAVLRGFLVDGRLQSIPAQRTKRRVVLDFLSQRFEPGRTYPEAVVNQMLGRFHPDHAALRRYLVDEGFLERRGGFYWRAGGSFDVG